VKIRYIFKKSHIKSIMKPLSQQNWHGNELETLKYFVQLVEDSTYEYNHISYSIRTHNSRILIYEILKLKELIKLGILNEYYLKYMIDELKKSLSSELIVKDLLKEQNKIFIKKIEDSKLNIDEVSKILNILQNIFEVEYKKTLEQKIINIINSNTKEYSKLENYTKSYLTELINIGYSKESIRFEIKQLFYNEQKIINDTEILLIFLNKFDKELIKFKIIFKFKNKDEPICEILDQNSRIKIKNAINVEDFNLKENIKSRKFFKSTNKYIEIEIKSTDYYLAIEQSKELIKIYESISQYYYHKQKIKLCPDVLILFNKHSENIVRYLNKYDNSSLLKKQDKFKLSFNENFAKLVNINNNLEWEMMGPILAHSEAINTNNPKHQFITLWSGLESILINLENSNIKKTKPDKTENKSQVLWRLFEPLLMLEYISKNISYFFRTFMRLYKDEISPILNNNIFNDFNKFQTFAKICLNQEKYNNEISKIKNIIHNENILFFERFNNLLKSLSSKENIKHKLNEHKNNVNWQLLRIYRLRNQITHSNSEPPEIKLLLINLHEYFDNIVDKIIKGFEDNPNLKSIEEIITKLNIDYISFNESLNENKINFEHLILNKF